MEMKEVSEPKKILTYENILYLLLSLVIILGYYFIMSGLNLFKKLQLSLLKSSDSIYFSSEKSLIITFGVIIAVLSLFRFLYKSFESWRKIFAPALIIISLFLSVYFIDNFFNYMQIKQDCITYKKGFFASEKKYGFSDISTVNVNHYGEFGSPSRRSQYRHPKDRELIYAINLKSGEKFFLQYSPDFWDKIIEVDNLLVNKGININRFSASLSMVDRFPGWKGNVHRETAEKVISTIFKVK